MKKKILVVKYLRKFFVFLKIFVFGYLKIENFLKNIKKILLKMKVSLKETILLARRIL